MKIYIGNDHTGIDVKKAIIDAFNNQHEFIDCGVNESKSSNYAQVAIELAKKVVNDKGSLGILICGSGEGMCIAANKINGIRAALIYNKNVAQLVKEHNNANVIAFGAREFKTKKIIKMIDIYLKSNFEGGRHLERINYILDFEKSNK